MTDESLARRKERRSIITVVKDGPSCLPPTAVESSDTEGTYPIEFNVAFWTGNQWMVNLGETLSLPEMCTVTPTRLVQCAQLFSDAVVFLAADLLTASTMYLEWVACCLLLSKRQVPGPTAKIIIEEALYDVGDFLRQCATQQESGVLTSEQLRTGFFDNIHIGTVRHSTSNKDSLPRTFTQHVAWEHIRDSHRSSRRMRLNHGRLWTLSDFRQLVLAWEATGSMPDDVLLLTNPWPLGKCSLLGILSDAGMSNAQISGREFDMMLTQRVILVGSYLMRHSFRSRHWTVAGERSKTNTFAEDQFKRRYLPLVRNIVCGLLRGAKQVVPAVTPERYTSDDLVRMFRDCWLENTARAYRDCDSVLESARLHIEQLRNHRVYLASVDYGYRCAACLQESWAHLLPCEHGLCTLCLRACHGKELSGCRMHIYECPVCEQNIGSTCIRGFVPPTASLRVLALDGGGIKGLVQLQILEHLLDKVRLSGAIHISSLFDLMVGSSIGNGMIYFLHTFENITLTFFSRWYLCVRSRD
jgi:hypothetical protein